MEEKNTVYTEQWSVGEYMENTERPVILVGMYDNVIQVDRVFFEWDGADYSEFVSNSTFAAVVALNPKKVVEEHIVTADEGNGNYYCERWERWEFEWYLAFQQRLYPLSDDGTATIQYFGKYDTVGKGKEFSVELFLAGDEFFSKRMIVRQENNYNDGAN